MGEVVLAAKVTHVPSLLLSEREGALKGRRAAAMESLKEIGRRARDRHADTFLIFDTHWLSNFGFHINANAHHAGSYTSQEAPHMIQDLGYDYPGNPALADMIAAEAAAGRPRGSCAPGEEPRARIRQHRSDALYECGWRREGTAGRFAAFRQHRGEPQIRRSVPARDRAVRRQRRSSGERLAVAQGDQQSPGRRRPVGRRFERVQPADGSSRSRIAGAPAAIASSSVCCRNTPPSAAARL